MPGQGEGLDGPVSGAADATGLVQLLPPSWIGRIRAKNVWVEGHRFPFPVDPGQLDSPIGVDLGTVCISFVRTVLEYPSMNPPSLDLVRADRLHEVSAHPPQFRIPSFVEDWVPARPSASEPPSETLPADLSGEAIILSAQNAYVVANRTNLGTFTLLATPVSDKDCAAAQNRVQSIAGLLGALLGRNSVYERLFGFEVEIESRTSKLGSVQFDSPGYFRTPNLSPMNMQVLAEVGTLLNSMDERPKARTMLALRWFYDAMRELDGTMAFIKHWVAIETLTMPDTTNIAPLVERLAAAYGFSVREVRQRVSVGQIFRLRGKILHQGQVVVMHQDLLSLVEGIFVDALCTYLNVKSPRLALEALAKSKRSATDIVSEVGRSSRS